MSSGIKRSLFSKPAWAAAAPTTSSQSTNDESIFGRNAVYEDLLVAEQKKREKKHAKAKERAEKAGDAGGRDSKRRRVSLDVEDEDTVTFSDSDVQSISSHNSEERRLPPTVEEHPVTRSTAKSGKNLHLGLDGDATSSRSPRRNVVTKQTPVNLDSDIQAEDDELIMLTPPKARQMPLTKPKAQLDDYESEEEDEFLQELKRKAREKARRQKLGLVDASPDKTSAGVAAAPASASASILSPSIKPPPPLEQPQPEPDTNSKSSPNDKGREKVDDPEVKLLITSTIPNTTALIVKRKVSQPLKQVREFWCSRNNLDAKTTAKIFFTWRGTRLFDSTTMRGPIQKLKNDHAAKERSNFKDKNSDDDEDNDNGDAGSEVQDPSGGRITLEAMTPELFDERQREKERKALQSDSDDDDYDNDEREAAAREEEEDKLKGSIIIRLVSQVLEPMNLRVRPHTSVGKMMQGFAATRQLDEGKTAWLVFDGERLEPESTVEDIGLEDQDEIEVHVR